MSSQNTRSTDNTNTSSGITAGGAARHPIDAARKAMWDNSETAGGLTGEGYSTGAGGVGNMEEGRGRTGMTGMTGTTGGLSDAYGDQSTGAGLTGMGAGTGLAGEHHGHHDHHHGEHATGTHVPGNVLGTGEGRLPGTGTTGTHIGYEAGRGEAGTLAGATGTHTGASTVEGDHKASLGEKIKGTVETMTGKITNDPERVAAGQQLKEGTHPSQTGSSATGTGSGRHGGI
jgi:hypothetical protein